MNGDDSILDPRHLRDVLGYFSSGVTVVTAMTRQGPVGFTCQSFTALSLHPPKVVICPSRASTSWPAIRNTPTFAVNVLAAGQRELSDRFARSGGEKFTGVAWRSAAGGAPLLDGVTAWFELSVDVEYQGGDHTVVVADILDLAAEQISEPLLFHRGKYCGVEEFEPPNPSATASAGARDRN